MFTQSTVTDTQWTGKLSIAIPSGRRYREIAFACPPGITASDFTISGYLKLKKAGSDVAVVKVDSMWFRSSFGVGTWEYLAAYPIGNPTSPGGVAGWCPVVTLNSAYDDQTNHNGPREVGGMWNLGTCHVTPLRVGVCDADELVLECQVTDPGGGGYLIVACLSSFT